MDNNIEFILNQSISKKLNEKTELNENLTKVLKVDLVFMNDKLGFKLNSEQMIVQRNNLIKKLIS